MKIHPIAAALLLLAALISITSFLLSRAIKETVNLQHYCEGVESQEHPDFRNIFYQCQYHGIRINSQCRAISVGKAMNPEYILYCKDKEPLQTKSIPMKEFQKP